MGRKSLYLLSVGILLAYYVYTPLPENFEEPWRMMLFNTYLKSAVHLVSLGFYAFRSADATI